MNTDAAVRRLRRVGLEMPEDTCNPDDDGWLYATQFDRRTLAAMRL